MQTTRYAHNQGAKWYRMWCALCMCIACLYVNTLEWLWVCVCVCQQHPMRKKSVPADIFNHHHEYSMRCSVVCSILNTCFHYFVLSCCVLLAYIFAWYVVVLCVVLLCSIFGICCYLWLSSFHARKPCIGCLLPCENKFQMFIR